MQSQWQSVAEVLLNTISGFLISWVMTLLVLNGYGYKVTSSQSAQITIIFTVVSIARSYFWRRLFNGYALKRLDWRGE